MRFVLLLLLASCTASSQADVAPPPPAKAKVEPGVKRAEIAVLARAPLPLTKGSSHRQIGVRALEKLANAIDAAGDDCVALARNLDRVARDLEKAIASLGEHGQQFKTLKMSRALRDRQKDQKAFVARCKKSEPLARRAIARTIGTAREYDFGYGGDHDGAIY